MAEYQKIEYRMAKMAKLRKQPSMHPVLAVQAQLQQLKML